MRLCTIGFGGKSAEEFFTRLREAGIDKLIDIRRSNNTLYCGFTRMRDLPFFLERLCQISYVHEPDFAPSLELLRDYQAKLKRNKKDPDAWRIFVERFQNEISTRPVMRLFQQHASGVKTVCLLCSEATPERCHRRLMAEHIAEHYESEIGIEHL
jgi:uncharacterized protein (DUF488 family)